MTKRVLLPTCLLLGLACTAADPAPEAGGGSGGMRAGGAGGMRAGGSGGERAGGSGGMRAGGIGGEQPGGAGGERAGGSGGTTRPAPGELDGAYVQIDCASEEIEFQYCHPKEGGNHEIPLAFGGEFGELYAVVLGVWAVTETVTYTGGTRGGDHYYIGGNAVTPATAQYGLRVGADTYWLNHQDTSAGEHYTFGYQYVTPPLEILGGSTVTLFVRNPPGTDGDLVNTNHMQSEVENPPPRLIEKLALIHSQPLEGQFVYVEVQSAKLITP